VGAYVTRQNGERSLALVGVSERIHNALKVTRVEQFFRFFDSGQRSGRCDGRIAREWIVQVPSDTIDFLG